MFLAIDADDSGQLIDARVTAVLRTGVSHRPPALGAATLVHLIGVVLRSNRSPHIRPTCVAKLHERNTLTWPSSFHAWAENIASQSQWTYGLRHLGRPYMELDTMRFSGGKDSRHYFVNLIYHYNNIVVKKSYIHSPVL